VGSRLDWPLISSFVSLSFCDAGASLISRDRPQTYAERFPTNYDLAAPKETKER
jgi:hypothetical protein